MNLCDNLDILVKEQGFELWGATSIEQFEEFLINVTDFYFKNKFYATMEWLQKNLDVRLDPKKKFPQANTIIVVAKNYQSTQTTQQLSVLSAQKENNKERLNTDEGSIATNKYAYISQYALGDDYHQVIGEKLRRVAEFLLQNGARFARFYVDTGPVFEKYWAAKAGIGWIGKNSLLINRGLGSFLFLGVVFTDLKIVKSHKPIEELNAHQSTLNADKTPKQVETLTMFYKNYCGSCTRCIDACPTGAIVANGVIDSNKCIAYLTVEHRGIIKEELRERMGGWVFGCDICQNVCPWNIKALAYSMQNTTYEAKEAKGQLTNATVKSFNLKSLIDKNDLLKLLEITEKDFNIMFRNSPIKRAKWEGFIRNVIIACANLNVLDAISKIGEFLTYGNPVLRATAEWALAKLQSIKVRES